MKAPHKKGMASKTSAISLKTAIISKTAIAPKIRAWTGAGRKLIESRSALIKHIQSRPSSKILKQSKSQRKNQKCRNERPKGNRKQSKNG